MFDIVLLALCPMPLAHAAPPLARASCCFCILLLSPHTQHEELREKLRIVRTVLEQGGTFSGINRKVQLKPTKWSTPSTPSSSKPQAADPAADAQAAQPPAAGEQPAQAQVQPQQQAAAQSGKAQQGGDGARSARTSSTGGAATAGAATPEGKPQVTELLLILKYGGVLTHAGRAQAEELGKTFRMVMYPRWGPGVRWPLAGCTVLLVQCNACVLFWGIGVHTAEHA